MKTHLNGPKESNAENKMLELQRNHPNIKFVHNHAAVWTHNKGVDFYEVDKWGVNHKGGSTIIEGKLKKSVNYQNPIKTPSINFLEYFLDHMNPNNNNFIKMDIEGAEYAVLNEFIKHGALGFIKELFVEFHVNKFDHSKISVAEHQSLLNNIKSHAKANTSFVFRQDGLGFSDMPW
jgi:FkbM family methyltransferase